MKARYKYAILGGVLGVPLSYFFQPQLVRQFVGFFDYVKNLVNINRLYQAFGTNSFINNVILSVVVFAIIGFIIGSFRD